jgi:hypothetical protein
LKAISQHPPDLAPAAASQAAQQRVALRIAIRTLVVLAAQTALASSALERIFKALGEGLDHGVIRESDNRFHAYVDGDRKGTFGTFDAAVAGLREWL